MPPFGPEQVSQNDLDMIIRFLKKDYLRMGTPVGTTAQTAPAQGKQLASHRP
jgi:hypothetical protein